MEAIPLRQSQDQDDLVCLCAGVSRARIKAAIATAPASTLESLGAQLGCGLHCGCCRPLVQEMLGQSPWYEVANATRTTLTDDSDPQRRIVQIDMQLAGWPPYPQALPAQHVVVQAWLDETSAALIINTTGFALSNPEAPQARVFRRDIPVLQAICSLDNQAQWHASAQGLGSRDLAMHVVLPELDGRLIGTAISFKGLAWRSERSQSDVVCYQAHESGMAFIAELASNWCHLAVKGNDQKRIGLILANYPTRDGRIGNGVGLDTPAAALNILRALQVQGYPVDNLPDSGTELVHSLLGGVTNDLDGLDSRPCAGDGLPRRAGVVAARSSRRRATRSSSWAPRP
jgi:bacterioferritin-associated ferredoxin